MSLKDTLGASGGAEGTQPANQESSPDTARSAEGHPTPRLTNKASSSRARVLVTAGTDAGSAGPAVTGKVLCRPERLRRMPRQLEDYDLT